MRCFVSWLRDDGTPTEGVDWGSTFDECVPVVGDRIVQPFVDGIDAIEVVERYAYFDEENDVIWHLIFKPVEVPKNRLHALRLIKVTEDNGERPNLSVVPKP